MQSSNMTTDHDEIRDWVESRGGWPAHVKGTGGRGDAGLLRIDFPGYSGSRLEEISWDEFFDKFDEENLAFVYQDRKMSGEKSYFNKIVSAENSYSEDSGSRRSSASHQAKRR